MIEKIDELKTEPVVGKFYLVPHLRLHNEWLPIIGIPHDDKELGTPQEHYHHDVRFMKINPPDENSPFSPDFNVQRAMSHITMAFVAASSGIRYFRKRCRRSMPNFPNFLSGGFPEFHKNYIGRKVLCGKCPHRGMALDSLPKDEQGMIVCNGHGLQIDTHKMEVVERAIV